MCNIFLDEKMSSLNPLSLSEITFQPNTLIFIKISSQFEIWLLCNCSMYILASSSPGVLKKK